jgi:hypothetical protein
MLKYFIFKPSLIGHGLLFKRIDRLPAAACFLDYTQAQALVKNSKNATVSHLSFLIHIYIFS